MMGHQSRQMAMLFVDIESLIPETHLLRKIERMVAFDFIYDLLAPYYPATGRPSVDPVSMFKMLLIGYLYGIKSERRLVEEVQLNIAYRWFCGFELDDTIPNHSTFSKTRTRKWQQTAAGALGAGRAALHQPHRLFAAGSGPLGILTGRAGYDHQLVHLRTLVKGPDAPLQDGLTAQIEAQFIKSHPGGRTRRHQDCRHTMFQFLTPAPFYSCPAPHCTERIIIH